MFFFSLKKKKEKKRKETKLKRKESKVFFFQKKIERKWKENQQLVHKNQTKVTSLNEKLYGVNGPPYRSFVRPGTSFDLTTSQSGQTKKVPVRN